MLCRYTSTPLDPIVSREIKRKSLTSAVTFTTYQVTKGISSCSNTRVFGPNKLSIFHLKHLGSRGIEYLTALFNDSVTSCRIPSIWKSSKSRTKARTPLSALLIGISRSSVQQRKLWRLSYFQPSTTTCFHPQTNTVSDPGSPPILICYNRRVISRQVLTKGNLHILQSVSLLTWRWHSIQSTTTYCYERL